MTGTRIAWAVVAAVLGEILLSIGQPSAYLPVAVLQIASSAALAGLVSCVTRRAWEAAVTPEPGRRAAGGPDGPEGGAR